MFPTLDRDVIVDVVRVKSGRYGGHLPRWVASTTDLCRISSAVDALLALNA